ncbi:MAG: 50S ribosomal protein L30 [Candidatus Hydrothermae bacterium]|uniref:50S ribosomal protein L30 n=1 Tax=candidate division WOR-3 bacterium TaxID=2052148 RepID=A0A7C1B421_UNCW3|nr:50S ribosomal protein L30 [Candidatus Hydrothermae bacterium]RKY94250.1 MAG: 50S ribosomal protein L30 [Candidatus Hydrothermae bacterium]HDM90459.1 50S ribosomal protein L30 [candidate division WOR-3 bacterium]
MSRKLRIRMKRSSIGKHKKAKLTLRALGLKKIGDVVEKKDTPQIRGMLRNVAHIVEVEEIEEETKND